MQMCSATDQDRTNHHWGGKSNQAANYGHWLVIVRARSSANLTNGERTYEELEFRPLVALLLDRDRTQSTTEYFQWSDVGTVSFDSLRQAP